MLYYFSTQLFVLFHSPDAQTKRRSSGQGVNKTSGKDRSTAHSAGRDDDRDERGSQSEKRRPVGLRDGSARDTSAGEVNLLTVLDSSDTSADGSTSPMPPLFAVVYVLCEVVSYMPHACRRLCLVRSGVIYAPIACRGLCLCGEVRFMRQLLTCDNMCTCIHAA